MRSCAIISVNAQLFSLQLKNVKGVSLCRQSFLSNVREINITFFRTVTLVQQNDNRRRAQLSIIFDTVRSLLGELNPYFNLNADLQQQIYFEDNVIEQGYVFY